MNWWITLRPMLSHGAGRPNHAGPASAWDGLGTAMAWGAGEACGRIGAAPFGACRLLELAGDRKARRSVSRVLSSPLLPEGTSADGWPFLWDARCRTPRATNPGGGRKRPWGSGPLPPLFGLAPGGVYRAVPVARDAVRSYRTLSPLPGIAGRFAFCGTFPGVAPAGRYPAPCFRGARTFLPRREGRSEEHTSA